MIVDAKNEKNNPARKDPSKSTHLEASKSKSREKREKTEGRPTEG